MVVDGDLPRGLPICVLGVELKNRSLAARGRALNIVAAAAMVLLSSGASALGLGRVNVQSVLGETLRAEIEVSSLNAEEASSLHVNLATPEAFKAAGVDYNPVLLGARISLSSRGTDRLRCWCSRATASCRSPSSTSSSTSPGPPAG